MKIICYQNRKKEEVTMNNTTEQIGKTVEEAIRKGLEELKRKLEVQYDKQK